MEKICEVKNKLGLHARASAKLVQISSGFNASLSIQFNGQEVDGKSILSILTLACPKGSIVRLRAEGEDEEKLLEAMERLIDDKFGEE
jgi:phosphocarrier protein HPr